MMSNTEIDKTVKATLDSAESIEDVKVSPFLKERILHHLDSEKSEHCSIWSWVTPSLQLAVLILVIAVNVIVIMQFRNISYEKEIESFAETYGLNTDNNESIIN